MLFNSVVFIFAFLPIAYIVFWALRTKRARYVWLTILGYVFYGYWDVRFCALMALTTCVSYFAGLGFLRWSDPRRRRLCLILPITFDLSLLAFFKYANFGLDITGSVLQLFGAEPVLPHLNIILPVGISFYTFHTITYIVDSYRGTIKPTRDFFEFSTYVSLFSQLVAGPIVRFRQIEADLANIDRAGRTRWWREGVTFFAVGLTEKVLVADSLAAMVDPALASYQTLGTFGAWMAMLGYSMQLYFDFSGYSSMAVGLGFLFGMRIPQNFNSPYKALDPSDFWRRWHISLSTVLRDYLYIPLGGNRRGTWLTYRNLMITMLLGGLWHGAAWTFVAWGAYHGLLLSAYRVWQRPWDALPREARQIVMLVLVVVGWVFFRATDFTMAAHLLGLMFWPTAGSLPAAPVFSGLMLSLAMAWAALGPNVYEIQWRSPQVRRVALTAAFACTIALILGGAPSPFLYFQF